MLKAIRYLKPFWLSVAAVIILVFAQVQLDLALPDLMSGIVTYGIQYGGISESMPQALSEKTYERMTVFCDPDMLSSCYEKKETGDAAFTETWPALKDAPAYILRKEPDETELKAVVKAYLYVTKAVSSIPEGMTEETYFRQLADDPARRENIISSFSSYTEDNLTSAVLLALKSEYQKLGVDLEKKQSSYILSRGMIMLGIALLGSLCAAASSYLASRASTGACRNMRQDVFEKVESFSSEEFSRFSTASLITRTTNDVQRIQQLLTMLLRIVLFAPMMGLTSLFKVMRFRTLASILGWAVMVMIVLMIVILRLTLPRFKIAQKLLDKLNLVSREQLSGMLVIRAFNNQKEEEARFDDVNTEMRDLNTFLSRIMAAISPLMTFIMSTVSVAIIWIGASQIDIGVMQIGEIMAFLQYSTHVLMSFMIVAMIFVMIPRSAVSANRIFEVLETEPEIRDPENPKHLPAGNLPVVFDHVCFRYPNAEMDVLEDITFTAQPGETIAVIGSTGSGKSTLINLLPRFFDITSGSIRIGDTDIRELPMKELRARIGYVPQKGTLFSGTIESNLKYADENASEEAIENALRIAQASDFVHAMPNGLQESIAEGGTNVSGGQKQRLAIARALTRKNDILIFDDTFSALDYHTDARLREALNEMIRETGVTVFIVAQRISTIMKADQIIVLEEGKIAGIGRHLDLLRNCEVYREIASSQFREEEMAAFLQEVPA
ncbi:MAG: ABC transporter ATP-binding protein/permease [Solobacterium sp.]|nr:ABC transporter ATP-binding protein/permease [Solobacterium sp.]